MSDEILPAFVAFLRLGLDPTDAMRRAAAWTGDPAIVAEADSVAARVSAGMAFDEAALASDGLFGPEAKRLLQVARCAQAFEDQPYAKALTPYVSELSRLMALQAVERGRRDAGATSGRTEVLILEIRVLICFVCLVDVGVPMDMALDACAESLPEGDFRTGMFAVGVAIRDGGELADALRAAKLFEERFVEAVRDAAFSPLHIGGGAWELIGLLEWDLHRELTALAARAGGAGPQYVVWPRAVAAEWRPPWSPVT